jgi:hypothetical protein
VPHLRDGFIVDKVGHFRGSENPDNPNSPMLSGLKTTSEKSNDHFITFSEPQPTKINFIKNPQKQRQNRLSSPKTTQIHQYKPLSRGILVSPNPLYLKQ